MSFEEKFISRRDIFSGDIIDVFKDTIMLPNQKTATREVVLHPGGVAVAAITEDNEILLVKQFRYPYGKEIYELPAGKLDNAEDPLVCGKRELLEETGATAEEYIPLGEIYPSPGFCRESLFLFLARGLTFHNQQLDEDEFLTVERVPFKKALEMVISGEIKDAKSVVGILRVHISADNSTIIG